MSDETMSPLSNIPPDWITLLKVASWVSRRFQTDVPDLLPELATALRKGLIRYRVAGLTSHDLIDEEGGFYMWDETYDTEKPSFSPSYQAVPGLTRDFLTGDVVVESWDVARVSWAKGTVRIRQKDKLVTRRLEIWWLSLEEWVKGELLPPNRRGDAEGPPTGGSVPQNGQENPPSLPDGLPAVLVEHPRLWPAYQSMLANAQTYLKTNKKPAKRDHLVNLVCADNHITDREAKIIYRSLPLNLRIPPRTRRS